MTQHQDLAKIKERIANLLAMAKDASSPNEAAIAAERARKLMDKYQLDEYDISEAAPHAFDRVDATRAYASIPKYIPTLAVAVAQYNDCQARYKWGAMDYRMEGKAKTGMRTKTRGKALEFLGHAEDAQLARQMLDYLLAQIDAFCKTYMNTNHPGRYNVRIGGEYKEAAAMALVSRLQAMTKERNALVTTSGGALVVIKNKAVDDHFGKVEYKKANWDIDNTHEGQRARSAGYRDGHAMNIRQQVEA